MMRLSGSNRLRLVGIDTPFIALSHLLAIFLTTAILSPFFSASSPFVLAVPAPQGAEVSAQGQSLVDQTTQWQQSTGYGWDKLAAQALLNIVKDVKQNGWPSSKCTLDNVYVRKEWAQLSKDERRDYIKAVKCLQTKPAKSKYPGAKNRYDDFVGVHIEQTLNIHLTGNFLTWHRYFTWAYEWTLRNECGYKGYQPYINWARWADDPLSSPVFDGSDTSISGDGAYVPHPDGVLPVGFTVPAQKGGGCIKAGPFKDFVANLGPAAPLAPYVGLKPNPQPDGLGYNPRCLIRDISPYVGRNFLQDSAIVNGLKNFNLIGPFQANLQDVTADKLGVHSAGHYLVAGDPEGDFFASPGDPYFFLQHSAIDRYYWTWQNLAIQQRTYVVAGTITFNNTPPSRPASLDDPLDLGAVGIAGVPTIRSASSTLGAKGSPFCYIYA